LSSERIKEGEIVTIAGLVTSYGTKIGRKSNQPYAIVGVEDFDGEVQFMLAGKTFESHRELKADQVIAVRGQVTVRDDQRSIRVYEITQIEGSAEGDNRSVEIQISDKQATVDNLARLDKILTMHEGYSSVILHMNSDTGGRSFTLPKRVRYSSNLASELKGLFGVGALSQLAPKVSDSELAETISGDGVGALVVDQGSLFESE
jgi:DNA polymerase-3 subunit alpha